MKNLPIVCDNCESKYTVVIEIEDETLDYNDPEFCSFCGDLLLFNELKFKDDEESYDMYNSDDGEYYDNDDENEEEN